MEEIKINNTNGQPTVSSLQIAINFEKSHKNIIQSIEKIISAIRSAEISATPKGGISKLGYTPQEERGVYSNLSRPPQEEKEGMLKFEQPPRPRHFSLNRTTFTRRTNRNTNATN